MAFDQTLLIFYALWALNTILSVSLIAIEIRQRNVAFTFWLATLAIFNLPSILDPFRERAQAGVGMPVLDLVNNPLVIKVQFFALIFGLTYLISRTLLYRKEARMNAGFPLNWPVALRQIRQTKMFVQGIALLCFAGVVSAILAVFFGANLSIAAVAGYETFLTQTAAIPRVLAYYLALTFGSGLAVAWWCRQYISAALIFLSCAMLLALTNSRQFLLPLGVTFVVYLLFKLNAWKKIVAITVFSVVAYLGLYMLVALRVGRTSATMWQVVRNGQVMAAVRQYQQEQNDTGEAGLRLVCYYFMQDDVRQRLRINGDTYTRLLLLPVPEHFLPGIKPPDPDISFYNEYYTEYSDAGDLPILMYGNAYENFGWLGALLGAAWGLLPWLWKKIVVQLPLPAAIVLAGDFGAVWVHFARGAIYNGTALLFWGTLAIYCVSKSVMFLDRFLHRFSPTETEVVNARGGS